MSEGGERLLEVPHAAPNPLSERHRQLNVGAVQFANNEVAKHEDDTVEASQGSGELGPRVEVMHVDILKA